MEIQCTGLPWELWPSAMQYPDLCFRTQSASVNALEIKEFKNTSFQKRTHEPWSSRMYRNCTTYLTFSHYDFNQVAPNSHNGPESMKQWLLNPICKERAASRSVRVMLAQHLSCLATRLCSSWPRWVLFGSELSCTNKGSLSKSAVMK